MSRSLYFKGYQRQRNGKYALTHLKILQNGNWLTREFLGANPDGETHWVQFTGLHDKNGMEIYEGDVIEFPAHDRPFSKRAKKKLKQSVVYWFDGHTGSDPNLNPKMREDPSWFNQEPGFHTREIEHDKFFAYAWSDFHNCEVIGNIYENPELLKREDAR